MDLSILDSVVQSYLDRGYFPSCVVSVFDEEKTLYRRAFGRNPMPDGTRQAVNTDTAYDMASCTKLATGTNLMLLMDQGELSLKTPIVDLLPEIKDHARLYERLRTVTVYQLMTHTSGLAAWYPFYTQQGRDFYDVFESFIGSTKVEEGVVYSDMNFMLLGKVLEKLKNKPLKACQEDLKNYLAAGRMDYQPLQYENTAPSCYGNDIEQRMVAERGLVFDGWRSDIRPTLGVNDGNAHYFFHDAAGHAGIIADADAYERLGRLYLTTSSETLKDSLKEHEPGRGIVWQVDADLYPGGCGHTGFTGTYLWVCEEKKIGVVALTNRLCYPILHSTNTNEFRRALARAVYERV